MLGIDHDRLDNDDKFLRHLVQGVRNGLGDRAATCIDPKTQIVEGRAVCLVSCERSPEPVFLRWKGLERAAAGDLYVRSGPGTGGSAPRMPRGTPPPASVRPSGERIDDRQAGDTSSSLEVLRQQGIAAGFER